MKLASLCNAFGVNKDYAKDLRENFLSTKTLHRKEGYGRPSKGQRG